MNYKVSLLMQIMLNIHRNHFNAKFKLTFGGGLIYKKQKLLKIYTKICFEIFLKNHIQTYKRFKYY